MTTACTTGWTHGSARERRRAARRPPDAAEPLARVRLRGGRELVVVNVSNGGALVEGTMRLLPGTHVDTHVMTRHGRVLVRSRVVRAYVCELRADAVRYRGALAFEHPIESSAGGYAIPEALRDAVGAPGTPYPPRDAAGDGEVRDRMSAQ